MNFFQNPCRCECQKQTIRSELILIAKRRPEQGWTNDVMIQNKKENQNQGTIAMEPKRMEMRRHSLFGGKNGVGRLAKGNHQVQLDFEFNGNDYDMKNCDEMGGRPMVGDVQCKKFSKNIDSESLFEKFKSVQTIVNQPHKKSQDHEVLKQKFFNLNLQEETQRKTMKKHIYPIRQAKGLTQDMLLTTKRCKKKYNPMNSPPQPNKDSLIVIEQEPKHKILKQKENKENIPRNFKNSMKIEKSQNPTDMVIKIMIDQISMMKKELGRLEEQEKRLFVQKQKNQLFFEEDFAIHEKKKESLKKSCQQRCEEINDLKKILSQCKNRAN